MMRPWYRHTLLAILLLGSLPVSERASAQTPLQSQAFDAFPVDERMMIQISLMATGHYDGMIDGDFGPLTVAAILKFQYANGYRETGILSASERALLKAQ